MFLGSQSQALSQGFPTAKSMLSPTTVDFGFFNLAAVYTGG